MGSVSYFEIGGHLVESMNTSPSSPNIGVRRAQRAIAGGPARPTPMSAGGRQADQSSDYDYGKALFSTARLRRARLATTVALGIAAADGPLPIGDAIAIAGLTIYAGVELIFFAHEVIQPNR